MPGTRLVSALLAAHAGDRPDAVAVQVPTTGAEVTYGELAARVDALAAGLHDAGLRRGDSLALWLPNGVEWVELFFAAARLGVLVVPLNTRYRPAEVAHLLGVGAADALVLAPGFHGIDFAGMAAEALAGNDRVRFLVTVGDGGAPDTGIPVRMLDSLRHNDFPPPDEARPEDPVVVFGTSGTTSFPKLAAHVQDSAARHAADVARAMEMGPDDRTLCLLPFCGTYGFVALVATLAGGGRAVAVGVPDLAEVPTAINRFGITCLYGVEAILRQVLADVPDGVTLRTWTKGGIAGISIRDVVEEAERRYGLRLVNLYGSSELFAMMATWHLDDPSDVRSLAGGRLLDAGTRARAVDPATREPLPDGESGELEFAGDTVTRGYLANDAANAAAFGPDGWYRTGDRGRILDYGRSVEYQSRLADTLRLRGYLVSPAEIEELLLTHDAVAAAQVVGVPDDATGEDRAVAFVVARGAPDPDQIRAHCRERAASWKTPERVVLVDAYPTTAGANGDKVQKGELRKQARQVLAGLP